MTEFYYLKPQR